MRAPWTRSRRTACLALTKGVDDRAIFLFCSHLQLCIWVFGSGHSAGSHRMECWEGWRSDCNIWTGGCGQHVIWRCELRSHRRSRAALYRAMLRDGSRLLHCELWRSRVACSDRARNKFRCLHGPSSARTGSTHSISCRPCCCCGNRCHEYHHHVQRLRWPFLDGANERRNGKLQSWLAWAYRS